MSSSDLAVITRAKRLCSYVMTVTQKSPKAFRFTFVSRLQNLALDVVECLFRANETFVTAGDSAATSRRLELQHQASTSLKMLVYIAEMAAQQGCLLMKQYEQISAQALDGAIKRMLRQRSRQRMLQKLASAQRTGGAYCTQVQVSYAAHLAFGR